MPANKKTLIDGDFQVGSNHLTVDTSNNYVGFNTATPQNKIDVQIGARTGTHSTDKPLYVTGVTSTSGAEFVSDDGTAGIGIGSSNIFTTETNQNLTIAPDGTGAVGIKTATPNPYGETFDLWVQGDTKVTGNVTAGTFFGDGSGLTNIISSQWDSSLEDIYFLNNSGSGSGRVAIGTTTPVSVLTLEGDSGGAPPTTGQEGTSNALVRVRDDNNVTLDIGTSSGKVWLQSSDATNMGTNYPVSMNPNGGNVGVGTISPGAPLEVSKSSGGEILRLTTSTGTLYAGADADPPWFGTSSNDHLRLMTNGTEKIRIESGGKVGVNTVTPLANLHVTGNTYVTSDLRVGSKIVMDEKVATFGDSKTFVVEVVGGAFQIDGVSRPALTFHERQTYIFDQSHSSNSGSPGHPIAFAEAVNGGTPYSTGVTTVGTPGQAGAQTIFKVPVGAPSTLFYYCVNHPTTMGSLSNAPSVVSTEAEVVVSGRVLVSGNVEASSFKGDGTELTGVALEAELASNVIRITNLEAANTVQSNLITAIEADITNLEAANTVQSALITSLTTDMTSNALRVTNIENNVLVSNSSGISTGFTRGDIIYASADNTLNKLALGTANQVLKSNGTDVVWGTDGGATASTVWLENGNKIYYNTDNVGIGTSTPAFKLDVHGTANVGALTATTLSVGGAAVALDADMTANAARVDALYTATTGDIIVATGTDTLGKLGIGSSGQVLKVASSGTSLEWTSDLTGGGGGGSGGGQWTGTTEIYFEGNVGISNTDPGHDLSVGSNLYVDDDGSNVLVIDGNLTAESMTLGGIGIVPSYPLSSVTDTGNTTPHTIEFQNAETGLVVDSNIIVAGNVTAAFLYGDVSNVTGIASNLHQIVENGNVTSNTVQFSNATTGLVTTANVEVGGDLTVAGNTEIGTANLFIDTTTSRVGVGTTTPGSALDVVGDAAISSNLAVGTNKLFVDTVGGAVGIGSTIIDITDPVISGAGNGLYIHNAVEGGHLLTLGTQRPWVFEQGLADSSTKLCLRSLNSGKKFSIQSPDHSNVMTIVATDGGGAVGIGTTTPLHALDVKRDITIGSSTTTHLQTHFNIGNETLTGGDALMGYSGRNANNIINAATYWKHTGGFYGTAGYFGIAVNNNSTSGSDALGITDGELESQTHLAITSGGNVGIGTTSPTQKLDVNGVIKSNVPSWNMWDADTIASGILNFSTNYTTPQNCTVTLSTGRVTATVAGRYFASFHGFTESDVAPGTGCQYYIRKNGSGTVRNYHTQPDRPGTLGYIYGALGGITLIVDLAVNDYLDVSTNFAVHSANGAGFCGFMIG